jgi:pilus assembly protein CpaB
MQPIATKFEAEPEPETPRPDGEVAAFPKIERRRTERRAMDKLRAEALRNVMSQVEDRHFGGLREQAKWRQRATSPRLILVVVALLAGGLAAFLATQGKVVEAPVPVTEIVPEPTVQILVARTEIGIGQRLTAEAIGWEAWPEGAMRPEYVTSAASPDAVADMSGAIAKVEFFPGEPIRTQKLAQQGAGNLAAVLEGGMRGVSVSVAPEAASGGFIAPSDRVDVVLTRTIETGQRSETIVSNVRVLAINDRLGETGTTGAPSQQGEEGRADMFVGPAIATLELDSRQAETILNATGLGRLSLVLRSLVDGPDQAATGAQHPANQAIRITSPFWTK